MLQDHRKRNGGGRLRTKDGNKTVFVKLEKKEGRRKTETRLNVREKSSEGEANQLRSVLISRSNSGSTENHLMKGEGEQGGKNLKEEIRT